MGKYNVIVIGSGHNGLVAGAKLAKSGLKTLVLDKAFLLGGCSRTDPNQIPGYKFNTGSMIIQHTMLKIAEQLGLEQFGFEPIVTPPNRPVYTFLVGKNVQFGIYRDLEFTYQEISRFSEGEADNYRRLIQDWAPFMKMVGQVMGMLEPTYAELFKILESLGPKAMWLYLAPVSDIFRSYFSTDWMGGLARYITGGGVLPQSPGTGFGTQYLPRMHFAPGFKAKGGMAGLIEPLSKVIEHNGGEVRLNSGVRKILVEEGQAKGVRLESGEEIEGDMVVSNPDFRITFFDLVGEENLETEFILRLRRLKSTGSNFNVSLVLDEKFPIECSSFIVVEGLKQVEENAIALDDGRLAKPALWVDNPCPDDPSLAPLGGNYIRLYQIDPSYLKGTTWEEQKERRAEDLIDVLEEHVPGIRRHIVDRYVMCPSDLETYFCLPPGGGGMVGPNLTIDQMYSMRVPYRSPIKNLYQTGASVHPMGGVLGLPGYNTARIILQDLEKERVKLK